MSSGNPKEQIAGGYATLSHVWGTTPFTTLTSDNYKLLKSNIEISTLPRSFRDAISTCRYLSIEYLWIDSLCIVQSGDGSEEDWLTHATEMESIYLNCVLNLAIDHASSPHHGAFVERNPDFLQDCVIWSPLSGARLDETERAEG